MKDNITKIVETEVKEGLIKHKALIDLDDYTDMDTIGHQLICEVVMADEKQTSSLILTDSAKEEMKKEMDISKMYNDHPERAIVHYVGEDINKKISKGDLIYHMSPHPKMILIKDKILMVIQDYDIMGYRKQKQKQKPNKKK